jgi:hypothetical protein
MPPYDVFRAVGLPKDSTVDTLVAALRNHLTGDENLHLVDAGIVPSCEEGGDDRITCTAIFRAKDPIPTFLATLGGREESYVFELEGREVLIDSTFWGFTQMYQTLPNRVITAEWVHFLLGYKYQISD